MKKILLLIALATLAITGCESMDDNGATSAAPVPPTTGTMNNPSAGNP
jgi:nitrous oxide reductase accessory protein NosL